jgi:hypothetical protein
VDEHNGSAAVAVLFPKQANAVDEGDGHYVAIELAQG